MVFRAKPGYSYKIRVFDQQRRSAMLGTGTSDLVTANAIQEMLRGFRRRRQWEVLNALVAKRVKLPLVYDAHEMGTLDTLLKDISSPDLDPLVTEWSKTANAKYVKQVRSLIVRGQRFPASEFTRGRISNSLANLKVSGSTKNRYRAAFSVFAGWLTERDVLGHNPVRDVRAAKANPPRELYHEREDAQTLVKSLPSPFRAIEALMANGLERQVIERLSRKDVTLDKLTINAHGSKTQHRNRVVRITEAWTVPIIKAHLKTLLPNAPVLTVKLDRVLDRHKKACVDLKIPVTTLHDWRHTYAVNSLRDGMKPTTVARQLGHRDASLVHKVYGRFIVDERDYAIADKRKAK
jgi:integrase